MPDREHLERGGLFKETWKVTGGAKSEGIKTYFSVPGESFGN